MFGAHCNVCDSQSADGLLSHPIGKHALPPPAGITLRPKTVRCCTWKALDSVLVALHGLKKRKNLRKSIDQCVTCHLWVTLKVIFLERQSTSSFFCCCSAAFSLQLDYVYVFCPLITFCLTCHSRYGVKKHFQEMKWKMYSLLTDGFLLHWILIV